MNDPKGSYKNVTALIVGLGSMGKRRVRCLRALGVENVHGFDDRGDRQEEAKSAYGIRVYADYDEALAAARPNVIIISVPPHVHHIYMRRALAERRPFFVEASVVDTNMEAIIREADRTRVVVAPSSTMRFHPGIQMIKETVLSGQLGKLSNIIYHSGQYLPGWHPYEKISDYYVSRRECGGAREIVPFELTWIVDIFGFPKRVSANVRKTIDIEGAETIDDTYDCLLDFGGLLAVFVVDVVSRFGTRRLLINGDKKQLIWDWSDKKVRVYEPEVQKWKALLYHEESAAVGYNANISETMYIEETRAFLDAALNGRSFPNTLKNDHAVLKLLYAIEKASTTGQPTEFLL